MATKVTKSEDRDPFAIVGAIARDLGRLAEQHGQLLRREISDGLGDSAAAAGTLAAGAGLMATGGFLGSLMLVHGLNRASRLPLWGCYGLVGTCAAAAGACLIADGRRRAAGLDFVPRQTIAALRDDLQWIQNPHETRTS